MHIGFSIYNYIWLNYKSKILCKLSTKHKYQGLVFFLTITNSFSKCGEYLVGNIFVIIYM